MKPDRLKLWMQRNQLIVFIIGSILIAFFMTGASLWLYRSSGAAKLDLSRPGYENVRAAVEDDNSGTKPFSPTGELDDKAIKDFRSRYEAIKNKLDKTNNYDEADVSDDNLGIGVTVETVEPTN